MESSIHENASGRRLEALKMFRVLIRAAQRHSELIEKQCGVSGAQLWIMQEVQDRPGLRVGDVAELLAIHQTTASNLIDGLVKKGCIDKLRNPDDYRVVKLILSQHGKSVLNCAPRGARGLLPEALARLDEEQMRHLTRGLRALPQIIGEHDDAAALLPLPFTV